MAHARTHSHTHIHTHTDVEGADWETTVEALGSVNGPTVELIMKRKPNSDYKSKLMGPLTRLWTP